MISATNGLFIGRGILFLIVFMSFCSGFIISSIFGLNKYCEMEMEYFELRKEYSKLLKERKVKWLDHE